MKRSVVHREALVSLARCTGIAAVWCPIHGDCACPRTEDGDFTRMDDDACPLHARASSHPSTTAVAL